MRPTARVLSVAALASATLGFAASAALADPGAEVSPSSVSPGGSVTVSVTCEATGGEAPATIDATSEAFDEGTVQLQRVPGTGDESAGPTYRGTARVSSTDDLAADDGPDDAAQDASWTVDGTCPAAPGGKGKPWHAGFHANDGGGAVPGGDDGGVAPGGGSGVEPGGVEPGGDGAGRPCAGPDAGPCADAPVQHGVEAGEGGSFTGSVPALVAGGILIAGALGAAGYRLRHRVLAPRG
ncbi:hypothetical protein [Streptomyces sediminimaris]|uniref:hypothetical protein n=1 Tax=Streptomyces sediminimaris TaxID=3383721 RepID=UPI00399BA8D8